MTLRSFALMAMALTLGLACTDEPDTWTDDYAFRWQTEHVTVDGFDRTPDEACGGSLKYLNDSVAALGEHAGFDPATHIHYRWMSPEYLLDKCPPGAAACMSMSGVPRTTSIPDLYGVTHAALYENVGFCPAVLQAGLAQVFGAAHERQGPVERGDIEAMLVGSFTADQVEHAGHFVAYLIEAFGVEAVVELCVSLDDESTRDDWARVSEAELGLELDALLAEYAEYPRCNQLQYRAALLECSGPIDHVLEPFVTTELSITLDCNEPDVIGPIDGNMIVTRRLQVDTRMGASITVRDSAGREIEPSITTHECAPCSTDPQPNLPEHLPLFLFDPGVHTLSFSVPVDEPETFHVTINPVT